MIDYDIYCKIKHLYNVEKLTLAQIAEELDLANDTVEKWVKKDRYEERKKRTVPKVLDPYEERIRQLLASHRYTAVQIFQMIKKEGYTGGYTLAKDYVRLIRPPTKRAYLTLSFAPGEAAQVDFGYCGSIPVGNTMRKLSAFVMVLCHSRMIYVEFILQQGLEHFLSCHGHAFQFFGGVPATIMVDNCKVAVITNSTYQTPIINRRYADFAAHYGFEVKPCGVRKPYQKGRVENGIYYLKQNFLNGLEPTSLAAINEAAREWMDDIANVRIHNTTQQPPQKLFLEEKNKLQSLPALPYDCCVIKNAQSNNRFRINFEGNRYSVPAEYASTRNLTLRIYPDRLLIYHQDKLIAQHLRSFERNKDIEHPDHPKKLLAQRRSAREQKLLQSFLALTPDAEPYYQGLENRRLNARCHLRKIMALVDIYGVEKVARAIADALEFQAFSSEYITNLIEQRQRILPEPGPLHIMRNEDLLDLEIQEPDMNIYEVNDEDNNNNDDDDEEDNPCSPVTNV